MFNKVVPRSVTSETPLGVMKTPKGNFLGKFPIFVAVLYYNIVLSKISEGYNDII